jgi:hypothetical protein
MFPKLKCKLKGEKYLDVSEINKNAKRKSDSARPPQKKLIRRILKKISGLLK